MSNKWKPISDLIPEHEQQVLGYKAKESITRLRNTGNLTMAVLEYDSHSREWDVVHDYEGLFSDFRPTHYQLIKAPKKD